MRLAEKIPKGNVDRGIAARLGTGGAPAEIVARQFGIDALDLERVLAEDLRRDGLMQIGLNSLGPEEGLAEADRPFIGVQQHEDDVAEFLDAQGFERGDLHEINPKAGGSNGGRLPPRVRWRRRAVAA